ncbi:hypothetical protein ABFS82_04G041700 [Erythranthe guttata]|uniref:kinectin-like n=1 Tax=Erythranthe guttata TaxID=4155 RepID=UPI00064E0318|nr:PREDICTED: kinectin-like [Erythranthe guttata]|eukprot:XP_012831203.1 PREDICTED: kinectin-like [Erythranthe guttata]
MEHLLHDLKPSQAGKNSASNGILNVVNEWKGMGDNLFNSLVGRVSEIESREKNLVLVRESLDKRLKEVEEREREFEFFRVRKKRELALKERGLTPALEDFAKEARLREEKLDEDLKSVRDHIDSLEAARAEVEGFRMLQMEKLKEIENRERQIDSMGCSVEKRLRDVKQKEDEFDAYQDAKWRQLAAKEEILTSKRDEFAKEVELASERLKKVEIVRCGLIKKLELALDRYEGIKVAVDERFKEIRSLKTEAKKSLKPLLKEADFAQESLEELMKEFEEMVNKFNAFQQDKLQKLEVKERELSVMRMELLEEVKLRDEKLAERLEEIESREIAAHKSLSDGLHEADLIRESLEKGFKEFEIMEKDFNAFREDKLQSLEAQEQQLRVMRIELLDEVQFREEKMAERLKEIDSWESVTHNSLNARLSEADLIQESLEKRFKKFEEMEEEFNSFQQDKMRKLELEEQRLSVTRIELLKEVELRDQKATEQQKLAQDLLKCLEKTMGKKVKEMEAREPPPDAAKGTKLTRDSTNMPVEELEKWAKEFKSSQQKKMRELEVAGDKLRLIDEELSLEGNVREEKFDKQEIGAKKIECNSVKDCVQKEVDVHEPKAKELKEPEKRIKLEEDVEKGVTVERVDPRCEVQDRIIVELFMHSIEKDLEFLSDEVFKVLLHSSDPAKLILEAVVLFCAPPYVKDGDIKIEIQERGILLLDQLTKMSPNIPRCIREAAILVANAWKSKMRTSAENPLNVLGFLHFLAAYKISSCFNKVEILGFLKSVAEHKQTPGLFRVLGLTENIPGFIKTLINEKQYLLASTYIYECQLENTFPQAAVLNYYVIHAKFSAKAKAKTENNPCKAQDKAITSEIADLRLAIAHIIKYGLESEYSPYRLTSRTKQLETEQARLKKRTPASSSSGYARNREKGKRFNQSHDEKKRKLQEQQHDEPNTEARFCRSQTNEVPTALHGKANKRQRTNNLPYRGPLHQEGVRHHARPPPPEHHVSKLP